MEIPGLSNPEKVIGMMPRKVMWTAMATVVFTLSACSSQEQLNPEDLIKVLNYESVSNGVDHWPWRGVAHGLPKRWQLPIPVKAKGVQRAHRAMDQIEKELGQIIFDRKSIATIPDKDIRRGLIIDVGSAVGKDYHVDEHTCGNVGYAPGEFNWPDPSITEDGEINTRLYINLSSSLCDDRTRGSADWETAAHEFAHAMGIRDHKEGVYGDNILVSDTLWDMLRLLYPAPKSD